LTRVAIIDNYDSFTFNLVHLVDQITPNWVCYRNDEVNWEDLNDATHILFSPGPGLPSEAGQMPAIIERFKGDRSMFGICLGFQAMAESLGGRLYNLDEIFHGVQTRIKIQPETQLFSGIPASIAVGRYHSWAVQNAEQWRITAVDDQEIPMAAENVEMGMYGVQFHPESIMTEFGLEMVQNWLKSPSPRRR